MDVSWVQFRCFVGLLLSGLFGRLCLALPPTQYRQTASLQSLLPPQSQVPTKGVAQEQVNTVNVLCHPDSLEILIQADVFAVGAPVDSSELRLGVEHNDYCIATASSEKEYRIVVGLEDCGTKHWMTEDSLVYTNLLIYSPMGSPDGIIRMDEAVIPLECHYKRKYSLSSSSLLPTWIPFTSTQATVETLQFDLKLMTDDWNYERSANVYYIGEPIKMEASVKVGHHTELRVFLSSCVATLSPDIHSEPKYIFIENGCLVDSQLPDSRAHFLPRAQDEKLQLIIDAFKFHNDDRGELYITCHLNASPVSDTEAPNKACTFVNGRWRSADGNDYLCGYCKPQNEASSKSVPGSFSPRGFGAPAELEPMWRSGLKSAQVWDHEARIGPVTVLAARKSGPVPVEQLPPVLFKVHRPTLYGSHWRSGIHPTDLQKGLLPGFPTSELDEENETLPKGVEYELVPDFKMKAFKLAANETTTTSSEMTKGPQFEATLPTNGTSTESDTFEMTDPKK